MTNTMKILKTLAVLVVLTSGCEGSTAGAPAGTGGTAGVGGVGGGGAAGAAGAGSAGTTGTGGSVSCGAGEVCGTPAPVCQGSNCIVGANPCASFAGPGGATGGIGWDVAANVCWPTSWCEPSVTVTVAYVGKKTVYQRPASAVCPAGVTTYTYAPGTLMVWGSGIVGSEYHQLGDRLAKVSYQCVANSQPVAINC